MNQDVKNDHSGTPCEKCKQNPCVCDDKTYTHSRRMQRPA